MLDLRLELARYGAAESEVKMLENEVDWTLLRYVDLFPEVATRKGGSHTWLPAGVVERDERPLVYLYRADSLAGGAGASSRAISETIRALACRAEGSYLAIVHPGELVLYPIGVMEKAPNPERVTAGSPLAPLLMHDLANDRAPAVLKQQMAKARSLHSLLFDLITGTARALRASGALSIARNKDEVLPLVGRAIFARFLIDRGIINPQTFTQIYARGARPESAFETPELAARTCAWLDDKFNGELLPLFPSTPNPKYQEYLAFFERRKVAEARVLHHLTNVMHRASDGRLSLDLEWDGIDFAHVPIGLLSEVYEEYANEFYRADANRESVRYTPRYLAEFTVSHAFGGLPAKERDQARVLDPASGAGVFLVCALQRLVAERWKATGRRPDTTTIREILNRQICGFDINYSALTLAALSLYLTALELDPAPFPPEKLKFDRLLGKVLRNVRGPGEDYPYDGIVLGSLGKQGDLGREDLRFQIVTGNPPWTTFAKWGNKEYDFNHYASDMVQRIVTDHRRDDPALVDVAKGYEHNDSLPDTAFLWRAIEWAAADGVIAFVLGGRLLFKRSDIGAKVRNALFQALGVTGVLNGMHVGRLWPKLTQPFCILFARNRASNPDDRFTLVTPTLEYGPAGQPRMRVDAEARQPVEVRAVLERPHLFKVLTRGGRLDVDIVQRIQDLIAPDLPVEKAEAETGEASTRTIESYWKSWTNNTPRSGQGFMEPGEKTQSQSKTTRHRVAELLRRESLVLTGDDQTNDDGSLRLGLRINPRQLAFFRAKKLYRLADPQIFMPPLVLINQSFGQSPQGIRARLYLGKAPMVYKFNFYGFSCAGHPAGVRLAKYLFCLINSDLFGYYTLLVSAKFGVERRTLFIEDIGEFPIRTDLTSAQFTELDTAADALDLGNQDSWIEMNRLINKLYGLTPADAQVMRDTLDTMMPYMDSQVLAAAPASPQQRKAFGQRMQSLLQPFFDPDGEKVSVKQVQMRTEGWVAFDVSTNGSAMEPDDVVTAIAAGLADDEGASRLIQFIGAGHLRVAVRNQYRYLTLTRARLCAIDILREHGSIFPTKEAA